MRVPGAFELPVAARTLAGSGRFDAVVALGCVIRGDTPHFDYVAGECARGLQRAMLDTGVPVAFGVLTVETLEQALERAATGAGNKGGEAMESALEMAGAHGAACEGARASAAATRGLSGARSVARKLALQALYRWQLNGCPWQDLVQEFASAEDMPRADAGYFRALVEGVCARARRSSMRALAPLLRPQAGASSIRSSTRCC